MMMDIGLIKEWTDGLFRKILGLTLVIGGGFFLWEAAFNLEPKDQKMTYGIIGFIMGTALTQVLNFYYGTSQWSVDKSKQITKAFENGEDEK